MCPPVRLSEASAGPPPPPLQNSRTPAVCAYGRPGADGRSPASADLSTTSNSRPSPCSNSALLDAVRARAEQGAAIVYTTHYLPELTELGAGVAVAHGGRVLARGSASELLDGLPGEVRLTFDDEEVRVPTTDPTATLARLLTESARPVRAVDLRRPTLDDLYRSVARAH